MIIALTLLVAFIGVAIYILASNPKISDIGRIMFFAGLLAFLLRTTADAVGFLR